MMPNGAGAVVTIYRYPIKGLSAEKMDRVVLTPCEGPPNDRRFAIALGSTRFDPEHSEWLPRTHFVMLMRREKLAQLQTHLDAESGVPVIAKNDRTAIGVSVDPIRFRANIYFDGAPAWSEHDWIDGEIRLGAARLRVISPITRCAATQVNPLTAERDLDIVDGLGRAFGHINMGVYAEVVGRGEIAVGDQLQRASGT
jgi:uncharacterized protein YcbX